MLDLIMSWIVSTWSISCILGFYLAAEEFGDQATTSSPFNLLEKQVYSFSKVGSRLLHLSRRQFFPTKRHVRVAKLICTTIPACCPFERDIQILGYTFHIPALCKLNPFYDRLMELRFWALSYLDRCGEDITAVVKS